MTIPKLNPSIALLDMPQRIRALPVDERGYPVPWFVARIDGRPEFRVADTSKLVAAVRQRLCWVCGQGLGRHLAFLLGPMCAVNRVSSEPPCHRECAVYSARACPFLARPHMERREGGLPEETSHAGHMLTRNPGAVAVWLTRSRGVYGDGRGGVLFRVGPPEEVLWFAEGRPAIRAEVLASMETGLPLLLEAARQEGAAAVAELERLYEIARRLIPAA